jgi:multiple sugar transport system permease protein
MNRNQGSLLTSIYTILALGITVIFFFPFWWSISNSLRNPIDTFTTTGVGIPWLNFEPTLDNWKTQLSYPEAQLALYNSSFIAVLSTALAIIVGLPAAYALARFRFRFPPNKDITIWFISQRVLPPAAAVVPFFMIWNMLGIYDTKFSMIIVQTTFIMPFVVVIVRQTFIDLPIELEEAAMVDGATHIGAFLKVAVPLAVPAIAASSLIMFTFAWNDYFFASVLTMKNFTLPIWAASDVGTRGIHFWFMAVKCMIAIVLPLILCLLAQRYIVRGLTLGAVKG